MSGHDAALARVAPLGFSGFEFSVLPGNAEPEDGQRIALSSSESANNRFSREFSFSRSFSRLAWSIRRPPYCFFFSRVRLLRHADLLDRLNDGLASPYIDLNTRSIGDDLLSQFFLSAWHGAILWF